MSYIVPSSEEVISNYLIHECDMFNLEEKKEFVWSENRITGIQPISNCDM